jgi:hypothetical protein
MECRWHDPVLQRKIGAIYRVAASGGDVTPATKLKETERSHDEPFFLPDGKHFLYAVTPWRSPREIRVGELGKPEQDGVAIVPGQMPQFASGRLLFSRDGRVMAQVFDAATWKVSGNPHTLGDARYFSVSTNGVLAYHESSAESELKIFASSSAGKLLNSSSRSSITASCSATATCGAESPTPMRDAPGVSRMSRMSRCISSEMISARVSWRAWARKTGSPA